jgi:hypothetical protein
LLTIFLQQLSATLGPGSIDELIDDFNTCHDEGNGDQALVVALKLEAYDLIRRINGYIAYLKRIKQGSEE